MTRWITNNHDGLFTLMLTSLGVAILPDTVVAGTFVLDSTIIQTASVIKEIMQIIGSVMAATLSVMLIYINYPKFKERINKTKKHKS